MKEQQKERIQLLIVFFVPIFIASLFRFWDIDLRPLHSDEGVNSFFLLNLYNNNHYHYDPSNYHGPFLYYVGLIPFYIFGISDFSFRLMPVLFGIMAVALLYPLRKRLGKMGLLTTGLLIAISPANSFFSRDTIHETYLVFFSLAVVVSFFLYSEKRKSRYIYFAAASLASVITIKETYIITFIIYAISLAIAYGFETGFSSNGTRYLYFKRIFTTFGADCKKHKYAIGISIGIFLLINILFYSSFFTYYNGIHGILTTLKIWSKTGMHQGGHAKPFFYYFKLFRKFELPILVLGIAGFYYAFRHRSKFTVFVAFWAILIYVVYSLIPYKTPWLVVNILLPLSIMGGIFVNGIFGIIRKRWHYAVFYLIYVGIFGFFCYQSILLNFINYDDERCELVYVQTKRDIYNLMNRMESLSNSCGKDMVINVVSKEYWPLPWYFRGYKNARFWGTVIDNPNAPVILVGKNEENKLKEKLKGKYKKERFVLRPGVWLAAYIQEGLYNAVYGEEATPKVTTLPITKVSKDELEEGLIGRYYYNIECIGTPFLSRVENDSISFTYNDETQKPYRSPFGIEWEGYLSIAQKGVYQFATKSDDGSIVYIDGNLVVDNDDLHAVRHISGVVSLDEGFHHVRVKYFDAGGGAVMEFLWTTPGGKETLVPAEVLFHKK
ncbi:MAG TPA: flippase activity-associated protein Agl23 [Candidatus Wunengus sp. YC60]|uniref:flippase activity-associated protein Agl23 n=1 Tax=Candidatus Wunengus sp. YC60 TaxID=3367697 RepID=UPI0040282DF9